MTGRYSSTTASSTVCAILDADAETNPSPDLSFSRTRPSSLTGFGCTHTT